MEFARFYPKIAKRSIETTGIIYPIRSGKLLKDFTMKTILLNWLPPALETIASPSASVLKGYLQSYGYEVHVKYWNLIFNPLLKDFLNLGDKINESETFRFLPFMSYLAVHYQDTRLKERIKYYILSLKPQFNSKSDAYIDTYLLENYEKINALIDREIKRLPLDRYLYVGFSTQFNQWIIATILIARIRKIYPRTVFVAGGCGTRQEAQALLRNFDAFQYASWGEGEYSLLQLTRYLDRSDAAPVRLEEIPHLVYREDAQLMTSTQSNVYVDLNQSLYDCTDYFQQLKQTALTIDPRFPLEKGRGCHWRKCRFCFLNSGYKFRTKKAEKVLEEMKGAMRAYRVNRFFFLDNDLIADAPEEFDKFLDLLIAFRADSPPFKITMAEIVTKGITEACIRKMALAGFAKIQIGYESPSAGLLAKINKKNTFASNLLCIKWGLYYGIKFGGVNVLRNLLEETDEDIKEGIKNLFYLRFFLSPRLFFHNMSFLAIAESSRYFKKVSEPDRSLYKSGIWDFLPSGYMREQDKYVLIMDFVNADYNKLWDVFSVVEAHYLQNNYAYRLLCDEGVVYYRESYNSEYTKELEFDKKTSVHWAVLEACNCSVRSLEELQRLSRLRNLSSEESLADVVESLRKEGIIYCNEDKTEIVSVINTHLLSGN